MDNLVIYNNNEKSENFDLIKYKCETCNATSVILKLLTKSDIEPVICYKISLDEREKNLEKIIYFLNGKADLAIKGEIVFTIREYLIRQYIFISDGDSERQFTATRI